MKHVIAAAFFITTLIGPTHEVQAQARERYERFLVPIVIEGEAPGGFGSRWATRLAIHNAYHEAIQVTQYWGRCQLGSCPNEMVLPNSTVFEVPAGFHIPTARSGTGSFLHVARPNNGSVTFNLRVQDLSRQALTWGTELPVVSESEAFVGTLQLLNIPTDARFRVAIRLYDFEPSPGGELRHVRMRVFGTTNQILAETTVAIVPDAGLEADYLPGYAQFIDLEAAFPQLAASETVRVEITPISQGLRFWAFASVTNNETQHVTTISPQ